LLGVADFVHADGAGLYHSYDMGTVSELRVSELIERRYLGLVDLVRLVSTARDFKQLASGISAGIEGTFAHSSEAPPGVRVWVITADGFEESARYPAQHEFDSCSPRELRRAARVTEPIETSRGGALAGLHAAGLSIGVIEVDDPGADARLLAHAAPVIASRVLMLAGEGVGEVLLAPVAVDAASDIASLMSAFAVEAQRQLSHNRLSAYLLTCQGRAFERFAVATSPIVPGEGVIIPFEDVGLRHIVITDRALVSADLATDQRVVGREDRVIAAAGFHGLLSVPLRMRGRPIGVLNFVSRTPGFYSDEDIPIGQQIADQVAGFIDNLHTQQRMRALISHEVAERERTRVGRDVYHVVAQNVPGIVRAAEQLEGRVDTTRSGAAEELIRIRELAQGTLTDVRRAIADLLPRELDAVTLEEAAHAAVAPLGEGDPLPRIQVRGDTSAISPAVKRAACRILQEAITNVRLHAAARTLTISIQCDRDLELTVADDGVGFDPERLPESAGMGLGHMRERARALGGVLGIESAPDAGTRVSFELLGVDDAGEALAPAVEHTGEHSAAPTVTLRVFVVDRHPLMRAGLVHLAESVEGVRVIGESACGADARAQLRRLRPDVVLLDGHQPVSETERLITELRRELPMARIVITLESSTGHEAALIQAGASRFMNKTVTVTELSDALRGVAGAVGLLDGELPGPVDQGLLSARERSILLLMAAGRTNIEIGQTLFLATKTVERQVATVVGKLGARNRAHAAAIAVSRRIVDPEQAG
jgi:signal transduction histidine kinase/DNA-binding NarL/FixJ family response regulator